MAAKVGMIVNRNEALIGILILILCSMSVFASPSYAKELAAISMDVTGDVSSILLASAKDYPTEILPFVQDVRTYTPQCFDCHLPILYKLTGADKTMQKADFVAARVDESGEKVQKINTAWLANQTYQEWVSVMDCKDVVGKILENGTIPITKDCTDKGYYISKFRLVWSDSAATLTIAGQQFYITDTYGQRKAALSGKVDSKVDIVPVVKGTALTKYAWWNAAWTYRRNVTLLSSVATDEILPRNYTLDTATLISGGKMKSDCSDLRITNETDLEIPFYIESGCGTTKTLIWFKTTTDSDNTTSLLWFYYGNSGASDGQNKNGVYGGYNLYYDMGEGTGTTAYDGSSNGNNLNLNNGAAWGNGIIGNSTSYDGTNDYGRSSANIANGATTFTVNFWAYENSRSNNDGIVVKGAAFATREWFFVAQSSGVCSSTDMVLITEPSDTSTCSGVDLPASWTHVVGRWNGTYVDVFINGALAGSTSKSSITTQTTTLDVARQNDDTYTWGGMIDGLGFMNNVSRSNNFIKMSYDTVVKPLTSALGAEQTGSTPAAATSTTLLINGAAANATHAYTASTNDNITGISNTTGLYVAIYQNGTLKANTTSAVIWLNVFGTGFYNLTAVTQANASFSASSKTWWLTVTNGTNDLKFNMTNSSGTYNIVGIDSFAAYPDTTTIRYSCSSGASVLLMNATDKTSENNVAILRAAGYYNYTPICYGNANYSYNTTGSGLTISKASPGTSIGFNTSSSVTQGTPVLVTCSGAAEATKNLYNDTGATTNPLSVDTTALLGTYNYTCNSTATQNYTAGSDTEQLTVTLSGGLYMSVFNEKTLSPLTFNLTVYNSSYSQSWTGLTAFSNNSILGSVTMSVSSDGYSTRNYYVYVPPSSFTNITGYLLPIGEGTSVTYWAWSNNNPAGEPNALIDFKRFIGSGYETVAQSVSDNYGSGTVYLDPFTNYKIDAQTGDGSLTKNISSYAPTSSFLLRIDFTAGNTGSNATSQWDGLTYSLKPEDIFLYYSNTSNITNINYTVSSSTSSISWQALRVYHQNGTVLYFTNSTTASGATQSVNVNYGSMSYFTVQTWLSVSGYDVFTDNTTYSVIDRNYGQIADALNYAKTSGLPSIILSLIAMFCSFGVASIANQAIRTGAGVIYLGAMAVFCLFGWFSWGFFSGLCLLEMGIMMYKEAF